MSFTEIVVILDIFACIAVMASKIRFLVAYKGVIVPVIRGSDPDAKVIPTPDVTLGYHYSVSAVIFLTCGGLIYSLATGVDLNPFSVGLLPALVGQAVYLNRFPKSLMRAQVADSQGQGPTVGPA